MLKISPCQQICHTSSNIQNSLSKFTPQVESHDVTDGRNRRQPASAYYHMKKSHAEGMMDLSLLTANANQLKFILYYNKDAKTFYPALVLIILSLILQIAVGILLIFRVSRVYIKHNPCGSSTKCFKNLTRIWVLMCVCVYVYLTETI